MLKYVYKTYKMLIAGKKIKPFLYTNVSNVLSN